LNKHHWMAKAIRATAASAVLAVAATAHAAPAKPDFHVVTPLADIGSYEIQGKLTVGPDGLMYGTFDSGTTEAIGTLGSVYRVEADGRITIVHAFNDYWHDGAQPESALVAAPDGWLYGTAKGGGAHQAGVLFRVAPDGRFENVHDFDFTTDGTGGPTWSILRAADGTFYGSGYDAVGAPNIFAIRPDGSVHVLHAFDGGTRIATGVALGGDGRLYGSTFAGGGHQWGYLYAMAIDGAGYQVLHEFDCNVEGCEAYGSLVAGPHGAVYGATLVLGTLPDGSPGDGSVFRWGHHGFEVLHTFGLNAPDGGRPGDEVTLDGQGNLYGTTIQGAAGFGTVWRIDAKGAFTTLHTFTDGADGGSPITAPSVTPAGALLGVTTRGGANALGTLYQIDRAAKAR
jgi:uncharacterized repeat protein (TIGR03803 family)